MLAGRNLRNLEGGPVPGGSAKKTSNSFMMVLVDGVLAVAPG
jgi:hypothetical protein